jgi:Ca2+-transporting ATPase
MSWNTYFIYLQPLQALFNSAPLDVRAWMFAMTVGAIVLPIISLNKWVRNRRSLDATTHTKEIG